MKLFNEFIEKYRKQLTTSIKDKQSINVQQLPYDSKDINSAALELSYRQCLLDLISPSSTIYLTSFQFDKLLALSISSSEQHHVQPTTPFYIIEDILDSSPLSLLSSYLPIIDNHLPKLTNSFFFQSRSHLSFLRCFNAVIRRIPKTSTYGTTAGYAQRILSRVMSIDERSGVNVAGTFRNENIIEIDETQQKNEDESNENENNKKSIDSSLFSFYRQFWSLQSYFTDISKLKSPTQFRECITIIDTIINYFETNPIVEFDITSSISSLKSINLHYSPNFICSFRVFKFQLKDFIFRRTILLQILIYYQYLLSSNGKQGLSNLITLKLESNNTSVITNPISGLNHKQINTIHSSLIKVYNYIKCLPPGEIFVNDVLTLIQRDNWWVQWKDSKAPSIAKEASDLSTPIDRKAIIEQIKESDVKDENKSTEQTTSKFRSIPSFEMDEYGNPIENNRSENDLIEMGNEQLCYLWNIGDNEQIAQDESRKFIPTLDELIQPIIDEQNDDMFSSDLAEEDKLKNNKRLEWRTLRVVARENVDLLIKCRGQLSNVADIMQGKTEQQIDANDQNGIKNEPTEEANEILQTEQATSDKFYQQQETNVMRDISNHTSEQTPQSESQQSNEEPPLKRAKTEQDQPTLDQQDSDTEESEITESQTSNTE